MVRENGVWVMIEEEKRKIILDERKGYYCPIKDRLNFIAKKNPAIC